MIREDYILRLIKQIVDAIARIAGLRKKGQFEQAVQEAARTWEDWLHVPRELVDVLDTPTLAGMLKEPEKMRAAAQLMIEEAKARAGKGDPAHAAVCYRRALELYLEARAIAVDAEDDAAILELSRMVPPGEIDPRYRD